MYEKEKDFESSILAAFDLPEPGDADEFRFITRRGVVNWGKVVSTDINKVINEKDYVSLKENVFNIINYDLDTTTCSNILDPSFIKLFRLAQLTIEYLLHVQNHFRKLVDHLYEEQEVAKQEAEKQRKDQNELVGDLNELKNKSSKTSIYPKGTRIVLVENEVKFKCLFCGKAFLDGYYLMAHHQRRHPGSAHPSVAQMPSVSSHISMNISEKGCSVLERETGKIWQELESLRKRLNDCESCKNAKEIRIRTEPKEEEELNEDEEELNEVEEELNEDEEERMEKLEEEEMGANEETDFEQKASDEPQTKVQLATHNTPEDIIGEKFIGQSCSYPVMESQKQITLEEPVRVMNNGRLEAQERVWRGRLKAMADESSREIESLRKIIISHQEREHALEEEYEEKIEKLMSQLKEQTPRQFEAEVADKTGLKVVLPLPSAEEDLLSPLSSRDSSATRTPTPTDQPDNKASNKLNSTFTYAAVKKNETSDSELDSLESSTSPNVQRLPDCKVGENSRETMIEIYKQRLKYMNINPKAKRMPEKVFKEKKEVLFLQQEDMAKNIEGYHQIKSNLDEKADARVSQKLQRYKSDHSRIPEESSISSSTHGLVQTSTTTSLQEKWRNDESTDSHYSQSYKETSARTTSRSAGSSHSHPLSTNPSSSKSVMVEPSGPLRPWISATRPRSTKGMGTITAYVHPKIQEKSIFPGSAAFQTTTGCVKGSHGFSPGGSILRGPPPSRSERGDQDRMSAVPSLEYIGSKSVSFVFAHDLAGGKAYQPA